MSSSDAFKPRNYDQCADECRKSVGLIDWSAAILDQWPVLAAFEYWRLREELAAGQPLAAMHQLKDFAEVLIKLPVVAAGKLLILHGDDRQQAIARDLLVSRTPPSMGTWRGAGLSVIQTACELDEQHVAPWWPVLELAFSRESFGESALWHQLGELIPWRNKEIGHGALRLDLQGLAKDILKQIRLLNGELVEHCDAFTGIVLCPAGSARIVLNGHASLQQAQPGLLAAIEGRVALPLELVAGEARLLLGPYACLRYEKQDGAVGCYLINKRTDSREKARLHLLDYRSAATLVLGRSQQDADLLAELDHLPEAGSEAAADSPPGGSVSDNAVRDFLDATAFSREFIAPDYLHAALRRFIADPQRNRGLFWLSGAPDVGKTLFAYSLATIGSIAEIVRTNTRRSGPGPLGEATVLVVPIRNAYRATPASLSSDVQTALGRSGDREFLGLESQLKDSAYAGNPPAAFSAWMALLRNELQLRIGTPFVMVLDGLDELPAPDHRVEGRSIADLLPTADELPPGVFLVLTSRERDGATPKDELCPEFAFAELKRAYENSSPALRQRYQLVPDHNPDYRAVLKAYFDFHVEAALPSEEQRTTAFEAILTASNHRFKQLSYFTALLAGGSIQPADLQQVSAAPLAQHLYALENYEPARKFALIRRILLELAAAEQAHLAEVALMEPAPVIEREWLGLDLLVLASRVGYPATNPRDLDSRFLAALYSIQELIRSYRGAAAPTSRFALGLKGMVEQLQQIKGWDTIATLWRMFHDALADFGVASTEEGAENAALIRLAGPAAALVNAGRRAKWPSASNVIDMCNARSENQVMMHAVEVAIRLSVTSEACAKFALYSDETTETLGRLKHLAATAMRCRANARLIHHELIAALSDYGYAIDLDDEVRICLSNVWSSDFQKDLAMTYAYRGKVFQNLGDLAEAVGDFDHAVRLLVLLRNRLGKAWPPAFQNSLAGVYSDRGNVRWILHQHSEGMADNTLAIDLREDLRSRLGDTWPLEFQNDLAATYISRSNFHQALTQHAEAVADNSHAVDLMENLRSRLAETWPPLFQSNLAGAYMNRGNVYRDLGQLPAAVADCGHAIDLMENLRTRMSEVLPPAFQNELATTYLSRGKAYEDLGKLANAVADYGHAIGLTEDLRIRLGATWPPAFQNLLAAAYMIRGNVLSALDQRTDAAADYGLAIDLMEDLRIRSGDAWPPTSQNDLAETYLNRGNVFRALNQPAKAAAVYGLAIDLMEDLRIRLGEDWSPGRQNRLAATYMIRGSVLRALGQFAEAVVDYGLAVDLEEDLCTRLGEVWPPEYRNALAAMYVGRSKALKDLGRLAEANADSVRGIFLMGEVHLRLD